MEQKSLAFVRPLFLIFHFLVMFSGAQHIYQSQNKCSMNDCENVYQVLRDFRNDINKLKHSLRQLQKKVLGDVVVEIRQMTPFSKFDNTAELLCSIHYRGYEWSVVNIFQQNTSGSFSVLNVSRNGKVESNNARINGSMTVSDDIVNLTVSFDVSRGPGVCELNQTYYCNIQLVDTSIGTKAASSALILEMPPLNLTVETMPYGYEYFGHIDETINCTATVNPNTTVLFLIGKNIQSENKYFFAERKNVQTFVESENNTGCYPTVRTVFRELRYFLQIYNFVGCLASDTVSGQSSISEFKTVFVLIIN